MESSHGHLCAYLNDSLNLSSKQLRDFSFPEGLGNLRHLDFSGNVETPLMIPESMRQLTALHLNGVEKVRLPESLRTGNLTIWESGFDTIIYYGEPRQRISAIRSLGGGELGITVEGYAGDPLAIEFTSDLQQWETLAEVTNETGRLDLVVNPPTGTERNGFCRVSLRSVPILRHSSGCRSRMDSTGGGPFEAPAVAARLPSPAFPDAIPASTTMSPYERIDENAPSGE